MFWRSSKTVISALLPLALVACGDKSGAAPRTQIPVVRAAVVQEAGQAARSFTGVVTARVQSDLGFRVAGKVLARLVDAGQPVQRGQVLMRIDPLDYQLAAQAQQQAVTAARARAAQSAADAARYRDLRGSGAIAESAYELAQATADTAQAQLAAAIAQAKVAENASGYTELLANADGIVTETLAEPGQVVSAGQVTVRLAQARSGKRKCHFCDGKCVNPSFQSRES
ncbi:efflux RND transporter periplasmic adaptor subunit [Pseudoduganella sp. FT93W]|uniref:Efflux RND transporter periplasmic adaptor subunit n=1 Tax=Duganella fentianensis TaxID=2692177 RepID=A0A845I776_9BURK|nr:efflux RND transporter periplasmic adaptor subunit [Duganella fentianensis]